MRARLLDTGQTVLEILEGGIGTDVVVTHPFGTVCEANSMLADALEPLGHVIAVNGRSQGKSARAGSAAELTRSRLVEDLEDVRRQLGLDNWIAAGESAGGFVMIEYALRHPTSVRALLLVSTAAGFECFADPESVYHPDNPLHSLLEGGTGNASHEERLWPAISTRPDVVRSRAATAKGVASERLGAHLSQPCSFKDCLDEIACPVLVVAGAKDRSIPWRWGEKLSKGIRDAGFCRLDESGHFPYWDEPERFAKEVQDWLRRLAPTPPKKGRS